MAGELKKAEREFWGGVGYVVGAATGTPIGQYKAVKALFSGSNAEEALVKSAITPLETAKTGQEFGRENARELTTFTAIGLRVIKLFGGGN
ncbi:MAG: hypothetical protein M3Y81_03565 [Chloroflexota bacterium]|nr:hypothetical protein [Chloroflexota bacterium]